MAPIKRTRPPQDDEKTEDSGVESVLSSSRRDSVSLVCIFANRVHADLIVEEESTRLT